MSFRHTRIYSYLYFFYRTWNLYFGIRRNKFGHYGEKITLLSPIQFRGLANVYLYDNTSIHSKALIQCTRAKFIMKKNSGAAEGLTVITGNHMSKVGRWFKLVRNNEKTLQFDRDIIVEEDVWIGTNVTLLNGVVVGRGAIIGSGTVCRSSIPPYAIVIGNPAKVVGFRFTPVKIIQHEISLYPEDERLPIELLEDNYKKYFLTKMPEIRKYLSITF